MKKGIRPDRVRRRLAATATVVLGAVWLVAAPATPPAAVAATSSEARMASEIAGQINAERAARGLSRLAVDGGLASRAQTIAESNRANTCHACHSSSMGNGEVVQWSGGSGASGRSTVAWMVSTSHRDILMSPGLTAIGIGLACYPDGGQEAVGRVAGTVTPGSPAAPVVTSRQDGSSCEGTPSPTSPPTTAKPPTTPPTTAPGQSSSKSSDGAVTPAVTPTAAPARGAAVTTTTRRPAAAPSARRAGTSTIPGEVATDEAEVADIFGDTTTPLRPSTTTTVDPDSERAAPPADESALDDTDASSGKPRTTGAVVVGLGMAAMLGVAGWRSRAGWMARGGRR